ncbi:MAG: hypothetical protein QOG15_3150 [Solirubrobacteraceae bacterium]|jgi:hypothetical protein|nr:hypothetical protein [Solirubrobacteraceae bacterium]
MSTSKSSGASLGSKAVALLILLFAAWVVFQLIKGFVIAVFWVGVVVFGVIAVLWAWRTLSRD